MEEFLPGLVKVMEERLGPLGKPLSTLLVLVITLAAIAWCVNFLWRTVIEPFIAEFDPGIAHVAATWGGPVFVGFVWYLIWWMLRRRREKRMLDALIRITGDTAHQIMSAMIDEYRQETIQRFDDLRKHLEERQDADSKELPPPNA